MTGCWWPCCATEAFNIRRYDQNRNVIWSATVLDGSDVQCIIYDPATDYLYVAGYNSDWQHKARIAKYDISGGAPSAANLQWEYRYVAGSPYYFSANSDRGFRSMRLDASGNVYVLNQRIPPEEDPTIPSGSSGPYGVYGTSYTSYSHASGYRVVKFNGTTGAAMWISNGLRLSGTPGTAGYQNMVHGWSMSVTGTEVFVGGYSVYLPVPPAPPSLYSNRGCVVAYYQSSGGWSRRGFYNFAPSYLSYEPQSKVSALETDGTRLFVGIPGAPTPTTQPILDAFTISSGASAWGAPSGNTAANCHGLTALALNGSNLVVGRGFSAGVNTPHFDSTTGVLSSTTALASLYPHGLAISNVPSIGTRLLGVRSNVDDIGAEQWELGGAKVGGFDFGTTGVPLCIDRMSNDTPSGDGGAIVAGQVSS